MEVLAESREDKDLTGRLEAGLLNDKVVSSRQLRPHLELPVVTARGAKDGATIRRPQ